MADEQPFVPAAPSNQQMAAAQGKLGFGKFASALICGWLASYILNQFSLHGVNFEMANTIPGVTVSSEVVKSTLEGSLEAIVVVLTPNHFVAFIVDAIVWVRRNYKKIFDAAHDPLPPQE